MEQNQILLCGTLSALPAPSHEKNGRAYDTFLLDVPRLSGAVDTLPVVAERDVLNRADLFGGSMVKVTGQVRSRNQKTETGRHLAIFVLADFVTTCEDEAQNEVFLTGTLCKAPNFRKTPLGREILDAMLAVSRPSGRSDYLPCIFWGRTARAFEEASVGTVLSVSGRLQSRIYQKQTEKTTRTAYEVSVLSALSCP